MRRQYIPSVSSAVIFISTSNQHTPNDMWAGEATSKVVGRKRLLVMNFRDRLQSKFENKSCFSAFCTKIFYTAHRINTQNEFHIKRTVFRHVPSTSFISSCQAARCDNVEEWEYSTIYAQPRLLLSKGIDSTGKSCRVQHKSI